MTEETAVMKALKNEQARLETMKIINSSENLTPKEIYCLTMSPKTQKMKDAILSGSTPTSLYVQPDVRSTEAYCADNSCLQVQKLHHYDILLVC